MGTLSVAVAVLLAAVSVSVLSTISLTERPKDPDSCREVSMEEYLRMAEYSAAEVESSDSEPIPTVLPNSWMKRWKS